MNFGMGLNGVGRIRNYITADWVSGEWEDQKHVDEAKANGVVPVVNLEKE